MTPADLFHNAIDKILSPIGLQILGQAITIVALLILARDIRRIHKEIHNTKVGAVLYTEKDLRNRLADKRQDMVKLNEALRRQPPQPVMLDHLHREIEKIIQWHFVQIDLIDALRVDISLGAKVSALKSDRAVRLATGLTIAGIGLQIAAMFV